MKSIITIILFLIAGTAFSQSKVNEFNYNGVKVYSVYFSDHDSAETSTAIIPDITLLGNDTVFITTDYVSSGGTSDTVSITFTARIPYDGNNKQSLSWTTAITDVGAISSTPLQVARIPTNKGTELMITLTDLSGDSDNADNGVVTVTLIPKRLLGIEPGIRW